MFLRIDRLQIEVPQPTEPDGSAAAAVQELLGGRFGEMSTLNNYMFQSFNMRGRDRIRPFYELIANIAAEEAGHVELVSASINLLMSGPKPEIDPADYASAPLSDYAYKPGLRAHGIDTGQGAKPFNSAGVGWNGADFVFSSGNLTLDLLHNFFLECGARAQKLRVYEMTTHPCAREIIGYLLVRGTLHAVAYGKALEKLTGVNMNGLLPIPKIENADLPESARFIEQGLARKLYRWSPEDYTNMGLIWNGTTPDGGGDVFVEDFPQGGDLANLDPKVESAAPEYDPEQVWDWAKFITDKANMPAPDKDHSPIDG